jgi:hypothetical protein
MEINFTKMPCLHKEFDNGVQGAYMEKGMYEADCGAKAKILEAISGRRGLRWAVMLPHNSYMFFKTEYEMLDFLVNIEDECAAMTEKETSLDQQLHFKDAPACRSRTLYRFPLEDVRKLDDGSMVAVKERRLRRDYVTERCIECAGVHLFMEDAKIEKEFLKKAGESIEEEDK